MKGSTDILKVGML